MSEYGEKCDFCKKVYVKIQALSNHLRKFTCENCAKQLTNNCPFEEHRKIQHLISSLFLLAIFTLLKISFLTQSQFHHIYAEGSAFHSFKNMMLEIGAPSTKIELASVMSCNTSKGYMGKCGSMGGYAELVNFDPLGIFNWKKIKMLVRKTKVMRKLQNMIMILTELKK